jgi:hypothetical protein
VRQWCASQPPKQPDSAGHNRIGFGSTGRFPLYHAAVAQLEGLVGGNTRDGSTPFSRMRKPPFSGGFRFLSDHLIDVAWVYLRPFCGRGGTGGPVVHGHELTGASQRRIG